MNQDYPRILILSSSFKDGDAISILNFFNGWPEESMYCISVVGRENAKQGNVFVRKQRVSANASIQSV